jgi:hypothetical protein
MKRKASRRVATITALETLEQVVAQLNPEVEPSDLAAQMVQLLAAPGRLEGARLWRIVNGTPTVWQQSGTLPEPDPATLEDIIRGRHIPGANGRGHTHKWPLGRSGSLMGVLEARPKGKLDQKTRGWLDLFRRYAEVALESSERRHAVI